MAMQKKEMLALIYKSALLHLEEEPAQELVQALKNQDEEILLKIANDDFDYCETHVHSEYSLLDGVGTISQNIKRASELGHKALAITDHRVTYGWYKMRSASDFNIKPLFGCEINVYDETFNFSSHCVLIAENNEGYRNILQIVSESHLNNAGGSFGMTPSVSKEFLSTHNEGVIVTTACTGGILNKLLFEKKATFEDMCHELEFWMTHFPNRLYLEIQNYDVFSNEILEEYQKEFLVKQQKANDMMIRLAQHFNLPLIGSNDVHYPNQGEHVVQDLLLCIKKGKSIDDPNRTKLSSHLHYMKDKWEMLWRFRNHPTAVLNTQYLADRCHIEYQKDYLLPSYPDLLEGEDSKVVFRNQIMDGIQRFYSNPENMNPLLEKFSIDEEAAWKMIYDRTEYEIGVLDSMGSFDSYIHIVAWTIKLAEKMGIVIGPGRGSSAGSIVCLALGIVKVCPLRFDLLFERFLNPERIEMPDIDVDIQDERRKELIEAVKEELGEDYLAQIVTFGTMQGKGSIREVGRIIKAPTFLVDKLAKLIPFGKNIRATLESVSEFKKIYEQDATAKQIIDYALMLEGKIKSSGVHAAGVIISNEKISNHASLQTGKSAVLPVIQLPMTDVDGSKLVKQDFLGLSTLSVLDLSRKLVNKRHDLSLDLNHIPIYDEKTFQLLSRGESVACFQLESPGMRKLLQDMHIEKLEDVIDCIALYRPGVLSVQMHTEYVKNKFNPSNIKYAHPVLEKILAPTRGIMIYQEQAMLISNQLAGFTMAKADVLRKSISKKKQKEMQKLKPEFFDGSRQQHKITNSTIEEIWHLIEVMSDYSFPKAHAVAYGYMAYYTAYFKANFPLEYMTSAIAKAAEKKSSKTSLYIQEAQRMGFEVLSPSINQSEADFTISSDQKIIFGLRAIRDVGKSAFEIVEERNANGPFKDIVDFRKRLPKVNKKPLEALIRSGCFDEFGINRNRLIKKVDEILKIKPKKETKSSFKAGNIGLPDFSSIAGLQTTINFPNFDEPSYLEMVDIEYEMFGVYIKYHPFNPYKKDLDEVATAFAEDLEEKIDGEEIYMGGFIRNKKVVTTKNKEQMAIYTIDDLTGSYNVVAFPRQYKNFEKFKEKDIILLKGKVNYQERFSKSSEDSTEDKEYEVQILVDEMVAFEKDAVEKLSPLSKKNFKPKKDSFSEEKQKVKMSLSQYLSTQGNKKIIVH